MTAKNELRERIGKEICAMCDEITGTIPCVIKPCNLKENGTDKILSAVRERVKELSFANGRSVYVSDLLRELVEGER